MMLILTETKKSIGQAVFVVGYARDSTIRTKQFDIEKALAPLIDGPSVNTNIPDEYNPQAPRVTLAKNRVAAHFSQIAAQLTLDVDNTNGKPLETIKDSLTKKINLFQSCLDKITPREQQRERGLVLTVRYPIDSTKFSDEVVFEYIQSRFLRVKPRGVPASAEFNVGYKTDDNYFFTLSIAQYKMFSGQIPFMPSAQWFDIATLPVVESGIEMKVDVNSRPLVNDANQSGDITSTILKKTFDFVLFEADTFIGME
jgi:hypothetical protein